MENKRNNSDSWFGLIYFNQNDSRVIVPKRFSGLGWTLNFGNPYAYIIVIALVAFSVALAYLQ